MAVRQESKSMQVSVESLGSLERRLRHQVFGLAG